VNMYALFICGPVVEQIYGPIRMIFFYVVSAAGGSIATFAFGGDAPVVGASGAIFGLFGVLFAASRLHLPLLDRRGRTLLSQVGPLILVNIVIGFSLGFVDNVAHLGGLAAGVLLGVAFPPGRVPTLRSMWQPGADRPVGARFIDSPLTSIVALVLLVVGLAVGLSVGFTKWSQP
jgi:membrane associated rhomboid family serine protease